MPSAERVTLPARPIVIEPLYPPDGGVTGILTHSGRVVRPDEEVPSLVDIALALSRQPRFGGHTRRWWSVAAHSLFVSFLAQQAGPHLDPTAVREIEMLGLMHDAHEALTGDVPTHFKPSDMRIVQHKLDVRIFNRYVPGGTLVAEQWEREVRALDYRALVAEAFVVGPPKLMNVDYVKQYFGAYPDMNDVELLRLFMDSPGVERAEHFMGHGADAPIVQAFIGRYVELL